MVGVGILESRVDFGFVNFDDGADEFFETEKNSLAQVRSNFSSTAFGKFAGESAIDNGDGNALISFVKIGNADAEDGIVKLVEWVGIVVIFGVGNTVNGDDVAKFLVLLLFENFALFAVNNHAAIFLLFEIVDNFAEFEVGDDSLSYGIDLNTIIFVMDFWFFITFHQGEEIFRDFWLFFKERFTPLNEGCFGVESSSVLAEGFRSDDSGFAIILNGTDGDAEKFRGL